MLVLAKSVKGKEYLYNPRTARSVSARSAETIAKIVNECNYLLSPGDVWHIHEVDYYDTAYEYAKYQKFTIRKGIVKDAKY